MKATPRRLSVAPMMDRIDQIAEKPVFVSFWHVRSADVALK